MIWQGHKNLPTHCVLYMVGDICLEVHFLESVMSKACTWICCQEKTVHNIWSLCTDNSAIAHNKFAWWHVYPAKNQISLHIHSVSSLFAYTMYDPQNVHTLDKGSSLFVDTLCHSFALRCSNRPWACFEREKETFYSRIALHRCRYVSHFNGKKFCVFAEMLQYYKANWT